MFFVTLEVIDATRFNLAVLDFVVVLAIHEELTSAAMAIFRVSEFQKTVATLHGSKLTESAKL